MKRILTTFIITSFALIMGGNAEAQSLKNILNQVTGNSNITDIVESITGMSITPKDIKGSWNYSGSAVKLESEDILKSASAVVAVGQLEKKMDEYLKKVGVKPGLFGFTFNEDQTFCTTYKGKDFNGTYTLSEDGKTLTLTYGKILNSHAINTNVNIGTESIELLFQADKILQLIGKLSATSDNATLKAISSLAGQYDGMKVGMKMTK
jgi:phosphotransferase system IIB component